MLLSVFKNTPLLTSLALSNATPPVPSEVEKLPDPQEVVNLPHLQSLRITRDAIPTANFLRHISYPALTTTNIDFPEVDCEQMAPGHLGDDLGNSIPQNVRYVSLRADRTGFYLYGWVEPEQDIDLRARTVSAPYAIRMFCENEDIDRCQTTCWIYSCMVSKVIHEALEVVHLDLGFMIESGGNMIWNDECFYHALSEMSTNMPTFYISSVYHLRDILNSTNPEADFSHDNPCPNLTYLWIGKLPKEAIKTLNSILKQRRRVGKVLDVLSVPRNRCGEVDYKRITILVHTLKIRAR